VSAATANLYDMRAIVKKDRRPALSCIRLGLKRCNQLSERIGCNDSIVVQQPHKLSVISGQDIPKANVVSAGESTVPSRLNQDQRILTVVSPSPIFCRLLVMLQVQDRPVHGSTRTLGEWRAWLDLCIQPPLSPGLHMLHGLVRRTIVT